MSDEEVAKARLLAYYEQKEREFTERVEELRKALDGNPDEVKRRRMAREVNRLVNAAEQHKEKS